MPTDRSTRRMRSLAEDLRQRPEPQLAHLLRVRPDLARPVPSDVSELAARAGEITSIRRALDQLDRQQLQVLLEAAAAVQPVTLADLSVPPEEHSRLLEIADELWARALFWGPQPDSVQSAVRIPSALASVGIETYDTGPLDTVELESAPTSVRQLDDYAGMAAVESTDHVTALGDHLSANGPRLLRTGGLGVREFAAVAEAMDSDQQQVGFWLELAIATGLVAPDNEDQPALVPTLEFDAWSGASLPDQWALLARAWSSSDRDSSLIGLTAADGSRITPASQYTANPQLRSLRTHVMQVWAGVPEGHAIELTHLQSAIADRLPRWNTNARSRMVQACWLQAEWLGLAVAGALTALGRQWTSSVELSELRRCAESVMPTPVEQFVAQADLTLVVPGPPNPHLRALLNAATEVESRGAARVHRVTAESLARAMDWGWLPADLSAQFEQASATPLPQPLQYLITDVARRHGDARIGSASSYLRCDDESIIADLLGHPRAASLGLVRLTPEVVVSSAAPSSLLDIVRSLGHTPVAEGADGQTMVVSHRRHRATASSNQNAELAGADEVLIAALARALTRTQRNSSSDSDVDDSDATNASVEVPRMAVAASAALIRSAQEDGFPIWLGHADNAGMTTQLLVDVVSNSGGALSVFDHGSGRVRTLAIARVTGVRRADPSEANQTENNNG